MEMMGKKIPKYVFALVAIVLLLVLFVPLVLMPYLNQKPAMDAKHIEAQTTLRLYDMKLQNIENYRGQVNDLKIRWDQLETLMFVDAKDTANDLNQMFQSLDVTPSSISVSDEAQAVEAAQSSTGAPLFSTNISLSFVASREKLLRVINYFEDQSAGSYYISGLSMSTVTQGSGSGRQKVSAGDLNVSMSISLYYFREGVPTEDATAAQ